MQRQLCKQFGLFLIVTSLSLFGCSSSPDEARVSLKIKNWKQVETARNEARLLKAYNKTLIKTGPLRASTSDDIYDEFEGEEDLDDLTNPSDISGFDCIVINVIGEQIASADSRFGADEIIDDVVAGTTHCFYPGITSDVISPDDFGPGDTIDVRLSVPANKNIAIQVLGLFDQASCPEGNFAQLVRNSSDPEKEFGTLTELGVAHVNLTENSTVTIPATYAANSAEYVTCADEIPVVVEPISATFDTWSTWYDPDAPETACNTSGTDSCWNGGLHRKVTLDDFDSCRGIHAHDNLGAFDWICYEDAGAGNISLLSEWFEPMKGISSLLTADGTQFRPNYVVVTLYDHPIARSQPANWYPNQTIAALPDSSAGPINLTTPNILYSFTSSQLSRGYHINADGVLIIGTPGARLRFDPDPSYNCDMTTAEAGGTERCLIHAGNQDRLWLEGNFNGDPGSSDDAAYGIFLADVNFSVIHNSFIEDAEQDGVKLRDSSRIQVENTGFKNNGTTAGMYLDNTDNSDFFHLHFLGNNRGLVLNESNYNYFEFLRLEDNLSYGLHLEGTTAYTGSNTFIGVRSAYNGHSGIAVTGSYAIQNRFFRVYSTNNGHQTGASRHGIYLANNAHDNHFVDVLAANNFNSGIRIFNGPSGNIFQNVTTVNNQGEDGIHFESPVTADYNSFVNIIAANNGRDGVRASGTVNNNDFINIISAHNAAYGINVPSGTNSDFYGALMVGNNAGGDCDINGAGAMSNLDVIAAGACTSSDPNLTITGGIDVSSAFKGRADDDLFNSMRPQIQADPSQITATINDWINFEHFYRAWGVGSVVSTTLNPLHPSNRAYDSSTKSVWDWALRLADTIARGFNNCPGGTPFVNHSYMTFNAITFAAEAFEDPFNSNSDFICEAGETCVYSPNIGAYQGHGYVAPSLCGDVGTTKFLEFTNNGR